MIGDSFSVFMGTATVERNPASGVFEEISHINVDLVTDQVTLGDGTNEVSLFHQNVATYQPAGHANAPSQTPYNMAIKIGNNSIRLRKQGTTDRIGVSGVQVDA